MIAKLKGLVDFCGDGWMILDVGGVGYKVFCSSKTLSQLPQPGEACQLYIETVVREDAFILYGFTHPSEQAWFTLLTSVQGVGPRVGLSLLSACEGGRLAAAIASQDGAYLTQADGVGPKLATRIVTELKGKETPFMGSAALSQSIPYKGTKALSSDVEDAISALTNLGYRRLEAAQAVQKVAVEQDTAPLNTLIKEGLKLLSANGTKA